MSLHTEAMRATKDRNVTAYQRENGKWSGVEMVNHPTPSGCERWMPTYSDKREWPDSDTAIREFTAVLPKPLFEEANDLLKPDAESKPDNAS